MYQPTHSASKFNFAKAYLKLQKLREAAESEERRVAVKLFA